MVIRHAPGVHSDTVGGAAVLIGPAGDKVIELNQVGSFVWNAIDGSRDVAAIVADLLAAVPAGQVTAEAATADVEVFLGELRKLDLIVG